METMKRKSPQEQEEGTQPATPAAYAHVDTSEGRIRYTVGGSGPPLILLHGIARSLDDWTETRTELEPRFTVYAIDLPGFGGSDRRTAPVDLIGFAHSVLAFLDALDVRDQVRIVGNSLGGAIALQTVALAPERFAALVLVDSAGFGSEVAAGLRALALPGVWRLLLRPSRRLAELQVRGIFHDPAMVTEQRIDLAYELASRAGAAEAMLETARSLGDIRGVGPAWRKQLLDEVRELDIPVLLLWGENDRVLPVRHLDAAREVFPEARTHLFPSTGHMPQIERPAEFGEVVAAFFDEVGRVEPPERLTAMRRLRGWLGRAAHVARATADQAPTASEPAGPEPAVRVPAVPVPAVPDGPLPVRDVAGSPRRRRRRAGEG